MALLFMLDVSTQIISLILVKYKVDRMANHRSITIYRFILFQLKMRCLLH